MLWRKTEPVHDYGVCDLRLPPWLYAFMPAGAVEEFPGDYEKRMTRGSQGCHLHRRLQLVKETP